MTGCSELQEDGSWVYEEVRLPDLLEPGRFDALGNKDPRGNLCLGQGGNIIHLWAVFKKPLQPGQVGSMDFLNVPGSYPLTGNVTEWARGGPGDLPHAVERGAQGSRPAVLHKELGIWDVSVDSYLQPGAPPVRVEAVEENHLGANGWLVSNYLAEDFLGVRFEQNAFLAWEQATDTYTASRIKTFQDGIASYRGKFDEATQTLVMEGEVSAGGVVEHERRETTYVDDNERRFKVFRQREGQAEQLSDEGIARRRVGPEHGNMPRNDNGTVSIVSLSRGDGSARVIGRNETQGALDVAAGIVILGPVYMLQFQATFRP